MKTRLVLLGAAMAFAAAMPAIGSQEWKVVHTFAIGGEGAWDYLSTDPASHRLFVPRSTHTMVIDERTGETIGDIPGQKNAHGVALVPSAGRGFITDGSGSVVVFDLASYAVLGRLPAMPDADGIIFDQADTRVLVVSGRGKALLSFPPDIDPKNGKIDAPIALRGEPEFLAADAAGKIYINLMTTNEVAVVDLKRRAVMANWSVSPGGQPVGMAIDAATGRLFIGCRGPQKLVVMETKSGKVIANLPIGNGVDAVKFDSGEVFVSTGDGKLLVARETSPGNFGITQTVATNEGARTMALDPVTHTLYLPTADFQAGPNGGRRLPKPGTFRLLSVAKGE